MDLATQPEVPEDTMNDTDIPSEIRDEDTSREVIDEPRIPEMSPIEIDRDESIYAQLIGAVANVRKMQTKS